MGEENNRKLQEQLHKETFEAKVQLKQLDLKIQELDALVERGKGVSIDKEQEVTTSFHFIFHIFHFE